VIVQAPSPSHASLHAGQIAEHEIEVVGARGGSLAEAVRVLSRGGIEASLLVTKRVRFDQLDGAPSSHILANGLTIVDFD
jgi:threonine dehydrogenase-like Zn-dependent dehydrogenase